MKRQSELLDIVAALTASRRLSRLLYSREQERDQDADDRDHYQEFNQCKSATMHLTLLSRRVATLFRSQGDRGMKRGTMPSLAHLP